MKWWPSRVSMFLPMHTPNLLNHRTSSFRQIINNIMLELKVKFDKKISLREFDNQIPKLVKNFPSKVFVLIKVIVKKNLLFKILVLF